MNLSERLRRLEERLGNRPQAGAFRLDNGEVFQVECDPISYLIQHGVETPRVRIVGLKRPTGATEPITESIYETIDQLIREPGE